MVLACKGIDILKRVLCLLLCVVLLFCFFMVPRAGAVALEATTIAYGGLLVGTILVGAGVVFSSHGDMVKVGNAMYKTLVNGSSAIGKTISSISAWAVEHGASLAKGALRVGKDLYQGIIDAFNASYSDGAFKITGGVVTLADGADKASCVAAAGAIKDLLVAKQDCTLYFDYYTQSDRHLQEYCEFTYTDSGLIINTVSSAGSRKSTYPYSDYNAAYWSVTESGCDIAYGHSVASYSFKDGEGMGWQWTLRAPFSVSCADGVAIPKPDLKYPSDDYLVKMPDIPSVDSATGDVTYPNDTAYTKDAVAVPYPVDTEGVKVPDIPFDKPVDKSTGKTMDGTDTGTDTDNPSKPGEGTDADNPSWPDAGSLSLPKLIASKFPFCIPFDVARLVGLLEAEPKAPVFRIPVVYANIVNEEIVIDFDKFADVLQIIRWGEIMLFVAGLVVITRNYIKW